MENRRFTVGIVGVYLFSVGLLSGMLFDRIRFDDSRTVLLKELDEHRHRLHQRLMAMEREGSEKGGSSHDTSLNGIQDVWVRHP